MNAQTSSCGDPGSLRSAAAVRCSSGMITGGALLLVIGVRAGQGRSPL